MYPYITLIPWINIYTFWLSLTICFFVFLFLLHRNSKKYGYDFSFFTHNILWFFLSIFFFSRLFYVISNWYDQRFIWEKPVQFFIMSDFNFSLFWAIFGFLLMYFILTKVEKRDFDRYIDGPVVAFFWVLVIWFIWAFLGWQVYGRETSFWIEILYNQHSETLVPYRVPIFPLALVYALFSFLLWAALYIFSLFVNIKAFIWYTGILLFCAMILVFEFFSWKQDILSHHSFINFPQLCAFILALWAWYRFYIIMRSTDSISASKHNILYND